MPGLPEGYPVYLPGTDGLDLRRADADADTQSPPAEPTDGPPVAPSDAGRADAGAQVPSREAAQDTPTPAPPPVPPPKPAEKPGPSDAGRADETFTQADVTRLVEAEKPRWREEWRRQDNRDWDGLQNEVKRLKSMESEVAGLRNALTHLEEEVIPGMTAQLAQRARTTGVDAADVYEATQAVKPLRVAADAVALAQQHSRQREAEAERIVSTEATEAQRRAEIAADIDKVAAKDFTHAKTLLVNYALASGLPMDEAQADGLLKEQYARHPELQRLYADFETAKRAGNAAAADRLSTTYWQIAGERARPEAPRFEPPPVPVYDPPQALGGAGGSAGQPAYPRNIPPGQDLLDSPGAQREAREGREQAIQRYSVQQHR